MQRFQRTLLSWFAANARDFPWRRTRDPYRTLVAEVMLQQTQTARVVPIYAEFLRRFPTVRSLAASRPSEVIRAWRGLGYNRRAIALRSAAHRVVDEHRGRFPRDITSLGTLPGVGPYTASAVACFAHDAQVPVVDTNVRRVLSRVVQGVDSGEVAPASLDEAAAAWLPPGRAYEWNQALMDLGATICRARAPSCASCPVEKLCAYSRSGRRPERQRRPREKFAGSRRHVRGVALDVLRSSPRGVTLSLLASEIESKAGHAAASGLAGILAALESDGLLALSPAARKGSPRGRVTLPG